LGMEVSAILVGFGATTVGPLTNYFSSLTLSRLFHIPCEFSYWRTSVVRQFCR
jgi:hypothetical protein